MRGRARSLWIATLAALLALGSGLPAQAARWQLIGNTSTGLDKVYLDLDARTDGDMKIASTMTKRDEPTTNSHGVTYDTFIQVNAYDCAGRRVGNIQSVAYLKDRRAGSSPADPDWRSKMIPLPSEPSWIKSFNLICGAGTAGGPVTEPAAGPRPAPTQPAPTGQVKISAGSGIIVDDQGFILTNAHVVNGCKTLAIKTVGTPPAAATFETLDPKNDLALIQTRASYGTPVVFRVQSQPARLGENIGVIGYPLPGVLSNEPKATFGQVNSVAGMGNDYTLLQISAPIQPGNSGGPVFDEAGRVVGVIVSSASPALAAKIGVATQNINFAIRGEIAQIFMTAHGVHFSAAGDGWRRLEPDQIAAQGERSAVQILCMK